MLTNIDAGGEMTATTEKMKDGKWTQSVFLPNGMGLVGQCLVQISTHETVMIGGANINSGVNNNVRNKKLDA